MDPCDPGSPGAPSAARPPGGARLPAAQTTPLQPATAAVYLDRSHALARTLTTLAAVAAAGWAFERLRLPAAWMIGPMAASAALHWRGRLQPMPLWLWRVAQATIGASVASNMSREVLARMAAAWAEAVGAAVATLVVGALLGFLLPRLVRVDRATALLGFVPGGASGVVAASAEFGADPARVALVQYVRVVLVLLSAPLLVFLAHLWEPEPLDAVPLAGAGATRALAGGGHPAGGEDAPAQVALALASVAAGTALARKVALPAGAIILSMLVGAAGAVLTGLHPVVPAHVNAAAMAVLGIFVGSRLHREVLSEAWRLAAAAGALSLGLMAACVGIGWVLHAVSGFPLLTALLATAPGAIETMTAMAVATGAEPGPVLTVHVLRLFLTLLLGPPVAGMLAGLAGSAPAGRLGSRPTR